MMVSLCNVPCVDIRDSLIHRIAAVLLGGV